MWSKNKKPANRDEKSYIERVKSLPCSVCDEPGPSDCHEIKQGQWYTSIALCYECHRGASGWHGTKAIWRVKKMDELDALNITVERILK